MPRPPRQTTEHQRPIWSQKCPKNHLSSPLSNEGRRILIDSGSVETYQLTIYKRQPRKQKHKDELLFLVVKEQNQGSKTGFRRKETTITGWLIPYQARAWRPKSF
jgi:hypothetical protein